MALELKKAPQYILENFSLRDLFSVKKEIDIRKVFEYADKLAFSQFSGKKFDYNSFIAKELEKLGVDYKDYIGVDEEMDDEDFEKIKKKVENMKWLKANLT